MPACHAGGREFESRRPRHSSPSLILRGFLKSNRVAFVALLSCACGSGFDPPCRVTGQSIVLTERPSAPAIGVGIAGFSGGSLRPVQRPDGSILLRWWRIASDPSAALDADVRGAATATVTAEIAVFTPIGSLVERLSVVVPTSKAGRTVTTQDFLALSGGIGLVYAETSTVPAPQRTKTVLVYGAIPIDGRDASATALHGTECIDCSILWSTAHFEDRIVVLYSIVPQRILGLASPDAGNGEIKYLVLGLAGELLSSGTLGIVQAGASSLLGAPSFQLISDQNVLLVKTQTNAYRVDTSLNVIGGPIAFPANTAPLVSWREERVAIAWTQKVLTPPDALTFDLFLQPFRQDGRSIFGPSRLSTAMSIQAIQHFRDGYAVTFADGPEVFAAVVDGEGLKSGGDLPLYSLVPPGASDAAVPIADSGLLIHPSGNDLAYFHWTNDGVERIEVVCDP